MKKYLTIFSVVIILVVAVGVGVFYFFYTNQTTSTKTEEKTKTEVKKSSITCGELKADKGVVEGAAPFAPVLRSALSGNFDSKQKICEWSVDNAVAYASFPKNGECIYGGNGLMTKGEHEISLKLTTDRSCGSKIKVTVN
jgi:hypothetical protein